MLRKILAASLVVAFSALVRPGAALADSAPTPAPGYGIVNGFVADQVTGLPIADAEITLFAGSKKVATTKSDAGGRFSFNQVVPALYTALATARGHDGARSRDIAVVSSGTSSISFVLTRATGTSGLPTIAVVSAGGANSLASTTTITQTVDPKLLANEGYYRFLEALRTLPGVNFSGGMTAAVGDDASIDIRGLGPTETQTLLDGHPIGPQGVYGINGGGGSFPHSGFNFSDSPFFSLSKVQVTFGSGSTGLYGTDSIGGTIDLVTLNPTQTPQAGAIVGFGNQGQNEAAFKATGTEGRVGWAVAGSAQGLYGLFAPQQIAQTARPNNNANLQNGGACTASNDLTTCNLRLNTYQVSANTNSHSALAKAGYALSQNTTLSGTYYGAWNYSDSTGNGDADNIPYDTRLAEIQANPGNCSLPTDTHGKQTGYTVITDSNPNACYSAQQFAANSYGPYGGGAGRDRGTGFFDYHTRLQTIDGHSTYTADYYFDHYSFWKSSQYAAGLDPTGTFFTGDAYTQFLNTQGILLSDDIAYERSDVGFGYFVQHQEQTRLNFQFNGPQQFNYTEPSQFAGTGSIFARGAFDLSTPVSLFANLWLKRSTVTQQTSFDPRISLVDRPTHHDVFRLTYGHSTGDPAPELKFGAPATISSSPQSLNPICLPNANSVGSGVNPNIQAEKANDYELGYAHAFQGDTQVQVNFYTTSVIDQLFAANAPLSGFPVSGLSPSLLAQFAARIASACPGLGVTPANVINYLGVSTTYNAANAQYHGVELSGRVRFTREFYADYSYNIQSAVQNGIPDSILIFNPFTINGAQIVSIPVHKASAALGYSSGGWDARLDGFYIGENNEKNGPAYTFFNGYVAKNFGNGWTVNLGSQNVFNQDTALYGYFGHQLFVPENHFFHDTTSIQQAVTQGNQTQLELFGLPSRMIMITLQKTI